jgi:hypothetical protein
MNATTKKGATKQGGKRDRQATSLQAMRTIEAAKHAREAALRAALAEALEGAKEDAEACLDWDASVPPENRKRELVKAALRATIRGFDAALYADQGAFYSHEYFAPKDLDKWMTGEA